MPLLSKNNKKIWFLHIPKTGGRNLYSQLKDCQVDISKIQLDPKSNKFTKMYDNFCKVSYQHLDYTELVNLFDSEFTSVEKITIIRNPWDRFLSEYFFRHTRKKRLNKFNIWTSKVLKELITNDHILDNHLMKQIKFINNDVKLFPLDDLNEFQNYINKNFKIKINMESNIRHYGNFYKLNYCSIVPQDIMTKNNFQTWKDYYQEDIDMYNDVYKLKFGKQIIFEYNGITQEEL